jgi:hypothetical protein
MKTLPRGSPEETARKYIDDVLAITKEHGMGETVAQGTYDKAVAKAIRAIKGLSSSDLAHARGSPPSRH